MNEKQTPTEATYKFKPEHSTKGIPPEEIAELDQATAVLESAVSNADIFPDEDDGLTGVREPRRPNPDNSSTFDAAPPSQERSFEDRGQDHRDPGEVAAASAVTIARVPADA